MRWLIFVFLCVFVRPQAGMSEISLRGSIHPRGMFHTSDFTEIALPFRILEVEPGWSMGDFEVKAAAALECRWSGEPSGLGFGDYDLQIREAYLSWFPAFGEVKVGKQIIAWGAADWNNPTDNLSAYDYYYLFMPGAERKIGSLSAAVDLYGDGFRLGAVIIPEHTKNRLPFLN